MAIYWHFWQLTNFSIIVWLLRLHVAEKKAIPTVKQSTAFTMMGMFNTRRKTGQILLKNKKPVKTEK